MTDPNPCSKCGGHRKEGRVHKWCSDCLDTYHNAHWCMSLIYAQRHYLRYHEEHKTYHRERKRKQRKQEREKGDWQRETERVLLERSRV